MTVFCQLKFDEFNNIKPVIETIQFKKSHFPENKRFVLNYFEINCIFSHKICSIIIIFVKFTSKCRKIPQKINKSPIQVFSRFIIHCRAKFRYF